MFLIILSSQVISIDYRVLSQVTKAPKISFGVKVFVASERPVSYQLIKIDVITETSSA